VKIILLFIILFPLLGAFVNTLVGRKLSRRAVEGIACVAILGALAMAATAFALAGQKTYDVTFFTWFRAGDFSAAVNVHYDPLAAIMALMVTFVSCIIHLYSVSFMRKDTDYVRYFSYLNLFVFAMLVIALADNLIFVYLGWEGVGFCSYGLIGFWYTDEEKATAGRKAFVLTRIGDVTFGITIALVFVLFNNFSISYMNTHTSLLTEGWATVLGLLLLWAAVGKSAQLPLTVWLPDAMAGPTPVSALIHAATMVTAGVYLLMRMFPILLLSPTTLVVIAMLAAVTALYSACAALGQTDIKRVLAYSTISQVSYMFLGVGAGDIVGGMFLLLSHAFFKSLLFLAAGCVIQALDEEHDIFKMGNLKKHLPMVYWIFLAGALSLSAFPPVGGYFSKDRILLATFVHPEAVYKVIWVIAFVGALLTPLYTMRLFFIAFPNRPGGRAKEEVFPIPKFMQWILWPLAFLSLFDGVLNLPGGPFTRWLAHYLSVLPGTIMKPAATPGLAWLMAVGDAVLVAAVVLLAYILFRRPGPEPARRGLREVLFTAFYLDRFYLSFIARPFRAVAGFLWINVDENSVDQTFEGAAGSFGALSNGLRLWTTGRLSTYLKMLFLGFVALIFVLAVGWYPW
jgi:NADH-quinone oxidoreductase subunit L